MRTFLKKLKAFLFSTGGMIAGAVAAALAAAVTGAMSPLGDALRDVIWPEKISVDQDIALVEKRSVPFRLVIADVSRGTGLSGGRVNLRPPDDGAVVLEGPKQFTFPAAAGSISVAPEGLTIEGRLPGKSQILVAILTNRGRRFNGHVDVETAATRPIPTNLDFSTGDWLIVLNGHEGALTMQEDPSHRFTGTARFDDGTSYGVKGWRDGYVFHANFRAAPQSPSPATAYKVEGNYCESHDWLIVNAKVVTYQNGAPVPNPAPLQRITQRCPGFPGILAEIDGDGAFMAAVSTK